MRVAVLAPLTRPILSEAAGTPRRVWDYVRSLQQRGVDVVLYAHPASDPALPLAPVAAELDLALPVHASGAAAGEPSFVSGYLAMERILDDVRDGAYDALHNLTTHPLPLLRAEQLGCAVFTTLPAPGDPWLEPLLRRRPGRIGRFVAQSWTHRAAWSDRVSSEVVSLGVRVPSQPAQERGDHLVWAGRIGPRTGAHLAILAARTVGRTLRLIGPVDDPGYHATQVEPLLGPDALWLGDLDAPSLRRELARAGVAVSTPCEADALGRFAIEAMSEGTPVAAFDQGSLRELVDHRTGALAPAGDVQALAQAIERATRCDPYEVQEQARRAHAVEGMVDRYLQLFRPRREPSLVVARTDVAALPEPRGPVSARLFHALRCGDPVAAGFDTGGSLAPDDEDRQLALYVLLTLGQRGFADVAIDRDDDLGCIALRQRLGAAFLDWADDVPVPTGDPVEAVGRLARTSAPSAAMALCQAPSQANLALLLKLRSPLHLKEGQVHARTLGRLQGRDHRVVSEVLAAIQGVGQAHGHAELYARAMRAVGLDPTPDRYLGEIPAIWLALPNLLALTASSAATVDACLGQLALLAIDSVRPNLMLAGIADAIGFDPEVRRFFYLQGTAHRSHGALMRHLLATGPHARDRVHGAAILQLLRDQQGHDLHRRVQADRTPREQLVPAV